MKKLLVSFSGGETSAYMAYWIKKHWSNKFDIVFVFANTGEEHEETLKFIEKCAKKFQIKIHWVEAVVNFQSNEGTTHKVVDFQTASRKGEPFEAVIKKYGIPNQTYKHCNREMKLLPIHDFVKTKLQWSDYYTAIGIRADEFDRMKSGQGNFKPLYPLISEQPMTKQKINFWWSQQEFRLNLKGYEGNCKTCWKKNDNKLIRIAQEHPEWFDRFKEWEKKYERFYPETQNRPENKPIRFFRNHKTVADIFEAAKTFNKTVVDDHKLTDRQLGLFEEEESCDIYAECG